MADESENHENEDFSSPHLPERYQKVVREKRQRRIRRQVLIGIAVIAIIAVLYFVLSGISFGLPALPAQPVPAATTVPPSATTVPAGAADFVRGPGLSSGLPEGSISLDKAIVALRTDYPAAGYSILSADIVNDAGRSLYLFVIEPKAAGTVTGISVYLDAATGNAYSRGEENARIPRSDAMERARAAVPGSDPDHIVLSYSPAAGSAPLWSFTQYAGSTKIATGTLDADTGNVISYTKIISAQGRPGSPVISSDKALEIAERHIIDRNSGQLPLNMSSIRYVPLESGSGPVAGQYTIVYERKYQDYLTDVDGFEVVVDSANGDVTGYTQQWTTPEHAFTTVGSLDVVKREATFAVLQRAKAQYPETVAGLRIVSAEARWKNNLPYGTVPRPGSIPLGWKVIFDDEIIRANASAAKGIAWVDVQSGEFISFEYEH